MKYQSVLLLLVSFLLFNCSDKTLIGPPIDDDTSLSSRIIGSWSATTYKVTYFPDFTFTDTIFFIDQNTQIIKPRYSRNGDFEIKDGILYLKTAHWSIFDSLFIQNGVSIVPVQSEITISGNILYNFVLDIDLIDRPNTMLHN